MVRSLISRLAVGLALVALAAASFPVRAGAQSSLPPSTDYHYQTAVTQVYGSQYPIAGHLDLQVFQNGIVRGYYHNAFQKAFIQVIGGRDGDYLWFDIGPTLVDLGLGIAPGGRLHVVATLDKDGSFKGQLYPEYSSSVTSSSITNPQPTQQDQFIFAAKQVDKSDEDYPFTKPSP